MKPGVHPIDYGKCLKKEVVLLNLDAIMHQYAAICYYLL